MFVLLITGVGSLIHIYALGYMAHDPGRRRFFGYFNLFVAAMLLLVLGDSYLLLYVGWEGVGLASYLLIAFYFNRNSAATAGNKAFFANRVGDVGLSIAIMLMFAYFGTHVLRRRVRALRRGGTRRTASPPRIGLMLLLGACGKSGQFPLQTWLPDAMEGPTPVSALIHAATMVTAGVYLIARSAPIFDASAGRPHRRHDHRRDHAALRLHLRLRRRTTSSGCSPTRRSARSATCSWPSASARASTRSASSTCSAHGFFKAALFLSAGSVMHAMNDQIDMRRFGGLWRVMPITFGVFVCGYLAIIGFPLATGFFTKDKIIEAAFDKGGTSGWILGICALLGAGLTAFYMTRRC